MEKKTKENLIIRPPVVVILGHVDSGKTSILDYIRKTRVAEKESGGITQHIGAYQIEKGGKKITFLDTPGHEAFSAMRARGAKVADIAILIVDSVQGVQPQTKEAILQSKLAQVPIIVALNKIDNSTANPEKAKQELVKEGILVESLGGKIPSVLTSAKTGQGVEELLELILLMAEMEDLKTDLQKPAQGLIIESYLNNQKGPVATLLLSEGVLKIGDIIGACSTFGKIKGLEDFQGRPVKEVLPACPASVIGFEEVPQV
ncbi:MAG: GTP-binding protein, partial [Acetobacterium sp.]|nr:GTP-binding protein [Acetobacterium sp.]